MKRVWLAAACAAVAGSARAAALLSATVYAAPAYVSVGQQAVVTVDLMNVGTTDAARFVTPSDLLTTSCAGVTNRMALSNPSFVTYVSGPTPSCTAYLAPGAHAFFTWVYAGAAPGTEDFTVSATGEEDTGLATLLTARDTASVIVALPAALSATIATSPGFTGTYRSSLTVNLYVTNIGQGRADNVKALALSLSGPGGLVYQGCPALRPNGPDCPTPQLDLAPGESATFAWQYLITLPGTFTITGSATAKDHYGGSVVFSNPSATILTVPIPAVLSLSVTGDAELIQGEQFRLKVIATNVGTTPVCQTGFDVLLNGSAAGIQAVAAELHDLADVLPNICFAPGQTREFTLLVTLRDDVPLGPGTIAVAGQAHETYSLTPAISAGAPLGVAIFSRHPGISLIDPNPFRPAKSASTRITFVVSPEQGGLPVSLKLYTLSGELVRTLVDEALPPGVHEAVWDGRNRGREPVSSGIVLVLYEGLGKKDVRKLAVIK